MLRILKLAKGGMMKFMTEQLKISLATLRLVFFLLLFILAMHISACLYVMVGSLNSTEVLENAFNDYTNTWLSGRIGDNETL